jgi:CheY-like chemotaxis protein
MQRLLERTVGSQIQLMFECDGPVHHVLIDRSQLEQIVMNLVVNARDAITVPGRVTIRLGATENHTTLEVTDTGSGMAPETAARVFEPYFTTKAQDKGTGLGLATVHGIVEKAGGEISVISELGHGTTFRIALPKTDLAPEAVHAQAVAGVAHGKVLLVDDDDQVRRLTERMLRVAGYQVVAASCGTDALAAARREPFDVLLTDLVMPGMSGRDLARDLVAEHPQMRVVFMSGYTATQPPDREFIAKPFDRQHLIAKLNSVPSGPLPVVR